MNVGCSLPGCFAGDGESCALGHMRRTDCGNWIDAARSASASPADDSTSEATAEDIDVDIPREERAEDGDAYAIGVPWSGGALGLRDMFNLTPRGRTLLIAVVGPHDAGKTTLLVGTYLKLLEGQRLLGARFANSRTLGAWESLASWMRMDDPDKTPTFPPHTSRAVARAPGLLHFALRDGDGQRRDVLLGDAPGEWFQHWATNVDDRQAEGARWLARHADGFIVVADSDRLSGKKRGPARGELRAIIDRLGNTIGDRPALLVWAKSDKTVPKPIREAIRDVLARRIPQATESNCCHREPETLAAVVRTIIERCWNAPRAKPIDPPTIGTRPFQVYRGHR